MSHIRRTHRERIYQPCERIIYADKYNRGYWGNCACLEFILSTLFWRPKTAHLETSCHFKSLGPSKVRILLFVITTAVYFRAITWHALPSWLISTTLESTTTQSRLLITTPRYQTFYTPRVILPLDLVDQTRLGPIKVHPVDFNNKILTIYFRVAYAISLLDQSADSCLLLPNLFQRCLILSRDQLLFSTKPRIQLP